MNVRELSNLNLKFNPIKFLFCFSYFLIVLSTMYSRVYYINRYVSIFENIALVILFFICIIQSKSYKLKTVIIMLLLIPIVALSSKRSTNNINLKLLLVIFASKNIDFDKMIKFDFILKIFMLLILIILHYLGFTNDVIIYRLDGTIRNSMGLVHPNLLGTYIMILCLEFIYLKNKKLKLTHYLILFLLVFVINYFCDSRTSSFIIIFLLIFTFYYDKINKNIFDSKLFRTIICNSFLILLFISYFSSVLYHDGNYLFYRLNSLFSGRLYWIFYYLKTYSINLFGNNLRIINSFTAVSLNISAMLLDNAYVYYLLKFGLLVYVILFIAFYKSFSRMFKYKEYFLIIIFLLLLAYSLMEILAFQVAYNVFLIYFSNLLFFKESGGK